MILAAALACFLAQAEDLPRLLRQLEDDDPVVREAASTLLHRMGERIVPDLERALGHSSLDVHGRIAELLQRIPTYAFRSILQHPRFPSFRRRWDAVIEAVIWKRPIPLELWEELVRDQSLRERRIRPFRTAELLAQLEDDAAQALRRLVWQVGVAEGNLELHGGGMEQLQEIVDFLPLVLRAEPDEISFEEVYGTLLRLQSDHLLFSWNGLEPGDLETPIRLLVQIRRHPELPPIQPATSLREALSLASRGPIVRGIADALGRSYSNRATGGLATLQDSLKSERERVDDPTGMREIYGFLLRMEEDFALTHFQSILLAPAKPGVPDRSAPLPERYRDLFARVSAEPISDPAKRVVLDLLEDLAKTGWEEEGHGMAAPLLRAIGTRVAEAAR